MLLRTLPVALAALVALGSPTTTAAQELPTGHPEVPSAEAPASEAPASNEAEAEAAGARGPRGRRGRPQDPSRAAAGEQAAGEQAGGGQDDRGQDDRGRGDRRRSSDELPPFEPVAAPPLSGLQGKQYFWFTMYPGYLVKFDPETDQVVLKVKFVGGLYWRTTLTHDQKRMLVVTDQERTIEVVDLVEGKLVGNHLFQEDGYILRVKSVRECPGGKFWLVQTDRVKKEIDRYSFEPSQWLLYDTEKQQVVRKLRKLPEALSRGAQLSADGTHWISERDGDLTFLDGRTFKELGRIDLSTPRFFGAGPIRLSGTDLLDGRDPTRARMLFTSSDPVNKRRSFWGVVDLDLENRAVLSVTEWGASQRSWGMRVAHKARVAAAMSGGRGDESRLVTYDLDTGAKLKEAYYEFRPRRSLVAISPDGNKLYVGVAGSDFEVFDRDLQRLPTVEFDGEVSGQIYTVDG